ncbi:MAG: TIGR00159 family protein [Verrucomicrobia bacterium]|nr:MAG: TIGR00159 family protein [Verrucomicrobiota bacterium]TAE87350.1 MAG: TIGR00159 family protein [Verrucomicrobiota bacterium]TAF25205.1 MAG: TIGR00159 family protein [Verrucomicrobiota bacterium]TAF40851.1 MAG: TIGR00159 family protein [Verrucomicrobiota bacterium]
MWKFLSDHWRDGIEILILAVAIYQIFRAFRATRGARILVGLVVILVAVTLLLRLFEFAVISWIITRAALLLVFAVPIIFQPELRNALAKLGSSRFFSFSNRSQLDFLEDFEDSVIALSKKRIGALFAIERDIALKPFEETGVALNADFSPELAMTVFFPKSPLHDGGMVIANKKMSAAACVFPVSQRELSDRSIGLRHRAAIGVSEETDCIAVIVSEETGAISICMDGQLERNLGEVKFRERMAEIFLADENNHEKGVPKEPGAQDRVAASSDRDLVPD